MPANLFGDNLCRQTGSARLVGRSTGNAILCAGACTIVLSLFPAEDDAHPALTLLKIVIMTLVLLIAGVAIYRTSRRAHQPDIAAR